MDPIAAFRKQQERLGNVEKTVAQLRESNPRWASIFDRQDTAGTGLLGIDEVTRGFRLILGAGASVPTRRVKQEFETQDTEGTGALDFAKFCKVVQHTSQYMSDHPKWPDDEAAALAEEERQHELKEKERRNREGPDIYAVLGLHRTKEMEEVEARKRLALDHAKGGRLGHGEGRHGSHLTGAGAAIVKSPSHGALRVDDASHGVGGMTRLRPRLQTMTSDISIGGRARPMVNSIDLRQLNYESSPPNSPKFQRQATKTDVPLSPGTKQREKWERFSLSTDRTGAMRELTRRRTNQLNPNLPQLRALGKRHAACFALRFSPDGSQLAGGYFDGGVRIFDVDNAREVSCLNLPRSKGGSLRSAEERERDEKDAEAAAKVASLGGQLPVPHQDFEQEISVERLVSTWEPITNLRWRPSAAKEGMLATIDGKGTVGLWEIPRSASKSCRSLLHHETKTPLNALAWTSDGSHLLAGGSEHMIQVYSMDEARSPIGITHLGPLGHVHALPGKVSGHSLKVMSLLGSPANPQVVISCALDRYVLAWDIRAPLEPILCLHGAEVAGDSLDISRDGNTLLVGNHRTKAPFTLYDLRMDRSAPLASYDWCGDESPAEGGGRPTACLPFSCGWDDWENKLIVAGGEHENLARVYERSADPSQSLKVVGTIRGKEHAFWSGAISADGHTAAFGSADGAVCFVDIHKR